MQGEEVSFAPRERRRREAAEDGWRTACDLGDWMGHARPEEQASEHGCWQIMM